MTQTLKVRVVCRRVGLSMTNDLLALENASFTTDRISRRNLRRLLVSPSAVCMGAFMEGRLVGSVVVLFRRNTRSARIYSLAVSESVRGMGVGRRLLAKAEALARERGCVRMRLEVRMGNLPAIKLYQASGFADSAVIKGYYEDGEHAFVFRKELT